MSTSVKPVTTPQGEMRLRDYLGAVPEAPKDGKQYGRKDGIWVEVQTMRGVAVFVSITEPMDKQINDIWIHL
jgi:hypothetical protein